MQMHKAQRHSGSHLNFPINRAHKRVKRDAFFARNNPNRAARRIRDNVKGRYEDQQAAKG